MFWTFDRLLDRLLDRLHDRLTDPVIARPPRWRRTGLHGALVALGIASIVGSGGGGSAPECGFFSNSCNPVITPLPPPPFVQIDPPRLTMPVTRLAVIGT